jgi:hypothetical protein
MLWLSSIHKVKSINNFSINSNNNSKVPYSHPNTSFNPDKRNLSPLCLQIPNILNTPPNLSNPNSSNNIVCSSTPHNNHIIRRLSNQGSHQHRFFRLPNLNSNSTPSLPPLRALILNNKLHLVTLFATQKTLEATRYGHCSKPPQHQFFL